MPSYTSFYASDHMWVFLFGQQYCQFLDEDVLQYLGVPTTYKTRKLRDTWSFINYEQNKNAPKRHFTYCVTSSNKKVNKLDQNLDGSDTLFTSHKSNYLILQDVPV